MKFLRLDPRKAYLGNWLYLPKKEVNEAGIRASLSFPLPGDEEVLELWRELQDHILVPRKYCDVADLPFEVVDIRPQTYPKSKMLSKAVLDFKNPGRTLQRDAVDALLKSNGGTLQLTCGSGKTICALVTAVLEGGPVIIIVDTDQLVRQWTETIEQFMDLQGGRIGYVTGGKFDWEHDVVLATYHMLASRYLDVPEKMKRRFKTVVYEEGHHSAARTFSRACSMFYGKRIILSATPDRRDGRNVVYEQHIGKPVFTYLKPDLPTRVVFYHPNVTVNLSDEATAEAVNDSTKQLHLGKLARYFATNKERLDKTIERISHYREEGRNVLVLSTSVLELANIYAMCLGFEPRSFPTKPTGLFPPELKGLKLRRGLEMKLLLDIAEVSDDLTVVVARNPNDKVEQAQIARHLKVIGEVTQRLAAHDVVQKERSAIEKMVTDYVNELIQHDCDLGLITHRVAPEKRMEYIKKKPVILAIMKYGKEGLDSPKLDTVLVIQPLTDPGGIQQILGRPGRTLAGVDKDPVVEFFQDDVYICERMCESIQRELRHWPDSKGGPIDYHHVDGPVRRTL